LGVRVKLKIKARNIEVITSALVNSGFETEEPEILIPPSLAETLNISGTSIAEYRVAGGGATSGIRVDEDISVKLILPDRTTEEVKAVATILPGEDEVIISDKLASSLGIVILDPYKGLWCLRDELGRKIRKSSEIQIWR